MVTINSKCFVLTISLSELWWNKELRFPVPFEGSISQAYSTNPGSIRQAPPENSTHSFRNKYEQRKVKVGCAVTQKKIYSQPSLLVYSLAREIVRASDNKVWRKIICATPCNTFCIRNENGRTAYYCQYSILSFEIWQNLFLDFRKFLLNDSFENIIQ